MPAELEPDALADSHAPDSDASRRAGFPLPPQMEPEGSLAGRCVPGDAVTDDLIAEIVALERALAGERRAREQLERRLVSTYEKVDDDLRTALDTCRQLEHEKLAAFAIDPGSDAAIFGAVASDAPRDFTWSSLRARLEAVHQAEIDRHGAQVRAAAEQVQALAEQVHAAAEQHAQELREAERRADEVRAADQVRHADALRSVSRDHEEASRRAEELQGQLATALQRHAAERDTLLGKVASLDDMLVTRTSEREVLREDLAATRQHVHQLLTSTSWKASRPLRGVARLLGGRGR